MKKLEYRTQRNLAGSERNQDLDTGKWSKHKEVEKEQIHTVPLLQACRCRGAQEKSDHIVRKTGIFVPFQWPKESLDFAKEIREEAVTM
jgi:hypothetical protein